MASTTKGIFNYLSICLGFIVSAKLLHLFRNFSTKFSCRVIYFNSNKFKGFSSVNLHIIFLESNSLTNQSFLLFKDEIFRKLLFSVKLFFIKSLTLKLFIVNELMIVE
jgi:hypothetical protein